MYLLNHFSRVQLFVTPWTVAHQASLCMGFCRQESWSGFACPPPGALPNPGIKPISLMSPKLAGRFFTTSTTWEALFNMVNTQPKYWSINFSISSSNEYSGLISLDWLVWSPCGPRDSQEFYVTLKFESITSLALNLFYDPILTSIHDYRKSHSFE